MPAAIRRAARLSAALALLLCSACVVHLGGWGSSETTTSLNGVHVVVRDEQVFADGVELPYMRWVAASGSLDPAGAAELATATGELTLDGAPGEGWQLEVLVHSEVEGDGEVAFVDGALTVTPSAGRKTIVNGVRGTLPAGLAVKASSGTGAVKLSGFDGGRDLRLAGGTGLLALRDSKVGLLEVESGPSQVELARVAGTGLQLTTGTGDVLLKACEFETGRFESGTGELVFEQGRLSSLRADTGTGDVRLRGTRVGRLEVESGTGDVILSQGAEVAERKLDLGTGDLVAL